MVRSARACAVGRPGPDLRRLGGEGGSDARGCSSGLYDGAGGRGPPVCRACFSPRRCRCGPAFGAQLYRKGSRTPLVR
eukprot:4835667-Lingulodinium_polyedra.AAC.1